MRKSLYDLQISPIQSVSRLSQKGLWLLLLILGSISSALAQSDSTVIPSDKALLSLKLPPVGTVIQAAVENSPRRKYFVSKRNEEESLLKVVSREWTKYFFLDASYKYGMMGAFSSTTQQYVGDIFSTQMQHWFQVGVSIHFPIEEFFTRKPRVDFQKYRVEQAEMEEDRMVQEVTTLTIENYNKALLHMEVLRIKAEQLELNNIQYHMSENDFMKGSINIAELSRLKQLQVSAKIEYETSKSEFKSALLMLEMLSGLSFIKE